jgi:hypothetical protein
MTGPRDEDLSFVSGLHVGRNGAVPPDADQLLLVAEAIARNAFSSAPNQGISNWFETPDDRVKHIAGVLAQQSWPWP